jgi:predicted nucleic acid-binding Zn ribbon protein
MKRAGDLVHKILEDITDNSKFLGIFKEWKDFAGQDIAAHAVIRDIEQGYLLVDADHPGWMQRLQMKEKMIVKKIHQHYPELEIKGIKLFLKTIDNAK